MKVPAASVHGRRSDACVDGDFNPHAVIAAIYEEGGIRPAAKVFGCDHGRISRVLGTVEVTEGRLFDRETWAPTRAGEEFYRCVALPIVTVLRAYRHDQPGNGPTLTIGASDYIIQHHLTRILEALRVEMPTIRVHLVSGLAHRLATQLFARDIDLAILALDAPVPGLVTQMLLQYPVRLFVPTAFAGLTAEELMAQRPIPLLLTCPPPLEAAAQIFQEYRRQHGIPWHESIGAASTACVPQHVAHGDAAGPCVAAPALVNYPGVAALPIAGLRDVQIGVVHRGGPSRVVAAARHAIAAEAKRIEAESSANAVNGAEPKAQTKACH